MDCTSYVGQTRATPSLALVKALRMAHDEAPGPVFWPTPEKELAEHNRGKQRRSSSRDGGDRTRGGGGSGGGGKIVGVATTTTAARVTAAVVEAREARPHLIRAMPMVRGRFGMTSPLY